MANRRCQPAFWPSTMMTDGVDLAWRTPPIRIRTSAAGSPGWNTEAPKRGRFVTFQRPASVFRDPQVLRSISHVVIEAFLAASQPLKLFQEISVYTIPEGVLQVLNQIQQEGDFKFVRSLLFRMDHPRLKLALDVEIKKESEIMCEVSFKLVYL